MPNDLGDVDMLCTLAEEAAKHIEENDTSRYAGQLAKDLRALLLRVRQQLQDDERRVH